MSATTAIQWTDHTFNPWSGCTKVNAGCTNCYAEVNYSVKMRGIKWGPNGTRVKASAEMWRQPIKWNKQAEAEGVRQRVFCASLADVFEDWDGPISAGGKQPVYLSKPGRASSGETDRMTMDDLRFALFHLIDLTPWLDWQLLTKRPENVGRMWPTEDDGANGRLAEAIFGKKGKLIRRRENVWIGASCSDQPTLDEVVQHLAKCRTLAPILFLSMEPLLGHARLHEVDLDIVDWVICGGESGHNCRPCRPEWVRVIVEECKLANVPCFVKQMGGNVVTRNDMVDDQFNSLDNGWPDPEVEHHIHGFREDYQGSDCRIRLRDKKGGDIEEWPHDLRVREFPGVRP